MVSSPFFKVQNRKPEAQGAQRLSWSAPELLFHILNIDQRFAVHF
jgi:hypothetical protein